MITANDAIQALGRYRNSLDAMTHRLLSHGDMQSLRAEDDAAYLKTILAAQGLLDDIFGQDNQYSVLIKKIHNESMAPEGVQAPTLQSINAIIAVIDAVIARINNNPDFYIKRKKLPEQIEMPTSLYSRFSCFCSKHGSVIVFVGVAATIIFGLPGFLAYMDSKNQPQHETSSPSTKETDDRIRDKAVNSIHSQLTSVHR